MGAKEVLRRFLLFCFSNQKKKKFWYLFESFLVVFTLLR